LRTDDEDGDEDVGGRSKRRRMFGGFEDEGVGVGMEDEEYDDGEEGVEEEERRIREEDELDEDVRIEDEEVLDEAVRGEMAERVGLKKDDEFFRSLRDPKLPTREDVDLHARMGHLPFRDWCEVCVKAKSKERGHVRDRGHERGLPEYSWDYCFPGDELGFKWTVLVGRERSSRSIMGSALPKTPLPPFSGSALPKIDLELLSRPTNTVHLNPNSSPGKQ
jgi:hypothetical protein